MQLLSSLALSDFIRASLGWPISPFDMTNVVFYSFLACYLIEKGIQGLFDLD